jgi:hypothetical protein
MPVPRQAAKAPRPAMAEGFEFAGIVLGAEEDEGLALAAEGVDVEQDVVLAQQGAEPVADPVLVVDRLRPLAQVAVEVAVALARVLPDRPWGWRPARR